MLNDLKSRIGSHVSCDEWRLYEFTRNTRLPRGTFDSPRIGIDGWVYIICVGILGWLAACWIGNFIN